VNRIRGGIGGKTDIGRIRRRHFKCDHPEHGVVLGIDVQGIGGGHLAGLGIGGLNIRGLSIRGLRIGGLGVRG